MIKAKTKRVKKTQPMMMKAKKNDEGKDGSCSIRRWELRAMYVAIHYLLFICLTDITSKDILADFPA